MKAENVILRPMIADYESMYDYAARLDEYADYLEHSAQERHDRACDHFSDMPKFRGTNEEISEAASEWIDISFKIASGLKTD